MKYNEALLYLKSMFPPKNVLTLFPPGWVGAQNHRGLDAFIIFFKNIISNEHVAVYTGI